MKKQLTKHSTYSELKAWFEENKEMLPKTLDANHIYYSDVKYTSELYINQIDFEVERLGRRIKKSSIAKSSKHNLFELYNALLNIENWDKQRPECEIKIR